MLIDSVNTALMALAIKNASDYYEEEDGPEEGFELSDLGEFVSESRTEKIEDIINLCKALKNRIPEEE